MAEADIAIVGSGATGSLIATRLGLAGRRTIILEAGPRRNLNDLYSSTLWSRRLKWGGPDAECVGTAPVAYPFEAGWGTGGAALHHYACWFRLHQQDFRMKSLFGEGQDWPISYEDLRPYYDRMQREIGISGDGEAEVWRPASEPYPMPPLPIFRQGEVLSEGFNRCGMHVAPMPMAINSVAFRGRPACMNDGWCDAGCPTGALANPMVIFGKAMQDAGVSIRHDCFVTRILTDPSGRRAHAVEYFTAEGQRRSLSADAIVLAAYAIETPRLLLNSANEKHPAGLANGSGQVGRNFSAHGAISVYGMFEDPIDNHLGRTGGQLMCQDRYDEPARGYGRACTWRIGPALKLADLGGIGNTRPELYGQALTSFMQQASTRLASMSALLETSDPGSNQVRLGSRRDRFGSRQARIDHSLEPATLAAIQRAADEGRQILLAAGAKEVWSSNPRTEHMMGTVRFGTSPLDSVTNSFGQTHEVDNLFVTGPALYPTGGAVNPTYTATALAERTAEYIEREWSGLTGTGGATVHSRSGPAPQAVISTPG